MKRKILLTTNIFYIFKIVFLHSDYKVEYEKLKEEKSIEKTKATDEMLSKIKAQGPGSLVDMNKLITQVWTHKIL